MLSTKPVHAGWTPDTLPSTTRTLQRFTTMHTRRSAIKTIALTTGAVALSTDLLRAQAPAPAEVFKLPALVTTTMHWSRTLTPRQ
jgi:hypothetical protein